VASYEKCGRAGCAGDAAITADVHSLYRRHPSIEAPNLIDVQTLDGVVYLYGAVDTDMQRQLAEAVALEAAGVKRVVNAIGIANLGR
jgi:osmotically-inducible protein OsmY